MTDCLCVPVGFICVEWVETDSLIWPLHIEILLITYLFARMGFPSAEILKNQLHKLQSNMINFNLPLL